LGERAKLSRVHNDQRQIPLAATRKWKKRGLSMERHMIEAHLDKVKIDIK